jgi:hypothetical protein
LFGNCLGIVWELFGNCLGIVWEFGGDFWGEWKKKLPFRVVIWIFLIFQ